ncbi:hypothetical protein [Euzebya rosea]|uniref:hypothetical protein n=1 Tax=Euzebya rosea TaxID=2052804 RepID=UPI000D3E1B47|nr:hypothetical protein [Euzebya rosea]
MPITRVQNRKRPKNRDNTRERHVQDAAQARWLVNGSTATHEERLGLDKYNTEGTAASATAEGDKA